MLNCFEKHINAFTSLFFLDSELAQVVEIPPHRIGTRLSYIVNIIAVNGLTTQSDRAAVAILLIGFPWNIANYQGFF